MKKVFCNIFLCFSNTLNANLSNIKTFNDLVFDAQKNDKNSDKLNLNLEKAQTKLIDSPFFLKSKLFLKKHGIMLGLICGVIVAIYIFYDKNYDFWSDSDSGSSDVENTLSTLKLDDIGGYESTKSEFKKVIDSIKIETDPKLRLTGLLLYGPPGTGKTMFANAMAGELNAGFVSVSASEFENKYVGVGADNIRKAFYKAINLSKTKGSCILFIDKIDALGKKDDFNSHTQSINQLLTCLNTSKNHNVFTIFATNYHNKVDPAIKRSGRCDYIIEIPLPNMCDREFIIEKISKNYKLKLTKDNIHLLAEKTENKTGADIDSIFKKSRLNSFTFESVLNYLRNEKSYYY